jgi:iron(III) transport system substrate-binding protein
MTLLNRRSVLGLGAALGGASVFGLPRAFAADTSLTLYNGQHRNTTEALVDAFKQATGINVTVRNGSSTQLANQIIEEGARSPADVFYSEESPPVATLAKRGMLATIDSNTLKQVPNTYVAKDGTWLGASARCRIVAFNKSMIKESDLPHSVLDFATPAWKGRIGYVPTSGAFLQQIVTIEKMKGRDAALAWLKGLKQYGRAYNGNMPAVQAVERGEIAAAISNNYYWYAIARETGAANMKSALYYFGDQDPGALVTVSAAGILKSTKNTAAAQRFLAFMVSEAGQAAIVKTVAEYPLRPGVKSPFALKPFAELEPPPVTPDDLGDAADAIPLEREAGLA